MMANIIRQDKFIKSDHKNNNNKFYYISEFDDCSIEAHYGRVGDAGTKAPKSFDSQTAAAKFYDSKVKQKLTSGRNGEIAYRKLDVVEDFTESLSGAVDLGNGKISTSLTDIATEDIKPSCPEVEKLIKYLTKVNVHTILSNTVMTYNDKTGLFSTPCGIVQKSSIIEARDLLKDIGNAVNKSDVYSEKYGDLLNDYLMLIPQDIGRRRIDPATFFSMSDIHKQNDILDSLDASLQSLQTKPKMAKNDKEPEREKIFSVDLNVCSDGKTFDYLKSKYQKSMNRSHQCSHLKIKRIYEVTIDIMNKAFQADGKNVGGIRHLWHGTRAANLLSILKGGLIIPPSNAGHCTGRMFSNGIYFSDQSTKALNYAYGYWGGAKDNNCFMFLSEVAMGKSFVPSGPSSNLPKMGYDSTFAKAGISGVQNNEMIVYRTSQCNLKYLVEFSA